GGYHHRGMGPVRSRPLLRALGLSDHGNSARCTRHASLLSKFLHAARAAHLPALLWRTCGDLPRAAARTCLRWTADRRARAPSSLGVALWCQHLQRHARHLAATLYRSLLVPCRRGALLLRLAVRALGPRKEAPRPDDRLPRGCRRRAFRAH